MCSRCMSVYYRVLIVKIIYIYPGVPTSISKTSVDVTSFIYEVGSEKDRDAPF